METSPLYRCSLREQQFKSYYVVWKHLFTGRLFPQKQTFKSYYVVWKLVGKTYGPQTIIEFKSYYVVWKLINGNRSVQDS